MTKESRFLKTKIQKQKVDGHTHVQLLLRLRETLPVQRVDEKYDTVHRGKVVLPQLARRLVPPKVERLEADLPIEPWQAIKKTGEMSKHTERCTGG